MKQMVGIIGGLAPATTIKYMKQIIRASTTPKNQEQIPLCIWNNPQLLTDSTNLINSAKQLEQANCKFITMPCNTSHYWADDIQQEINIPFVNMIDETLMQINNNNYKSLTLLSTKDTIDSNIYEKSADKYGIKVNYPNTEDLETVSNVINTIKSDKYDPMWSTYKLYGVMNNINSDCSILGSTELSVLPFIYNRIFDPLQILTKRTIDLWNK